MNGSLISTLPCACAGPGVNTNVDGNQGHSPGCPANPHTHPQYLDDDGNEGVQFVRFDLAKIADEAIVWLSREGLYNDEQGYDIDAVWMRPVGEGPRGAPEEWYDIVPSEAEGAVLYWRLRPE